MIDQLSKTRTQKEREKKAKQDLLEGSKANTVLTHVEGVDELLKYTAVRFNAMREQLSICCELLKHQKSDAFKYVVMSKAMACGDYGLLLDEETIEPDTYPVEDAAEFTKTIMDLKSIRRPDTRMSACVETIKSIDQAIASWRGRWHSRVEKLSRISLDMGSTKNELDTASAKIAQFEEAQNVLIGRRELVEEIYRLSRKQLTDFIAKKDSELKTTTRESDVV